MARILVVDDGAGLRAALAAALRWAGHSARTAPGGEQALAMIEADVPDVVLLDLEMPQMDGFEVMARLGARWGGVLPVPVVIWTASDDEEVRQRARQLGASGYITKGPDDAQQLLHEIDQMVQEQLLRAGWTA